MSLCRLDVVAVDFLGHGDSKAPNQPELYTEEEVSLVLFIKNKSLCQLREEERAIFIYHWVVWEYVCFTAQISIQTH